MTPERWATIERLYHEVLSLGAEERSRVLTAACGDDAPLRREVESLLAQEAGAGFLSTPAVTFPGSGLTLVGGRVGPYAVSARIGEGGMGEVYRARDTKLGRDVALKMLPRVFTSDPDRLARFEREARVLASLNHPHIGAIYGFEESGGVRALVLELVEGDTLGQRLARGSIPVNETLVLARQIAEALEAAHDSGIVHRDLKPSNIKVTPQGIVKILDFGLAKLEAGRLGASGQAAGPGGARSLNAKTFTMDGTKEGMILGTVPYMSPEQARGLAVGKQTDIWAFGCVLYEMLTGRVAFPGATFSDTIAAILDRDPDWTALPATTPATVRRLLGQCLEKDQMERLRDIGDARIALREALGHSSLEHDRTRRPSAATTRHLSWSWMRIGVAAAVIVLSIAGGFFLLRAPGSSDGQIRLSLAFEGLTNDGATPVPSPDGRNFVFQAAGPSGRRSLWMRPLDAESAREIPGTEDAEQPFWFPDGQSVGFYARENLRRVSLSGAGAHTIAEVKRFAGGFANGAAANERGDVIFSAGNRTPLFRVRGSDGATQQLTRLDSSRAENSHRFPVFLPDGRHFLFLARSSQRENNALYVGSLDTPETRRLMPSQSNVSYVPPRAGRGGMLLYLRDRTLVEQRFDGERVSGEPTGIVENVDYAAPSLLGRFGASSNGTVLILRRAADGGTQLQWFSRTGTRLALLGPAGDYVQPRLSQDGSRVLFSRADAQSGNRDVWYMEVPRGIASRLTTHQANDWWPVWSPDGRSVLFGSDREGGPFMATYRKTSFEPGSDETRLFDFHGPHGSQAIPQDWSSDGNWIAFQAGGGSPADSDVWIEPTAGDRPPFPFLSTPFVESNPRFSPDNRWIVYTSNESGRYEVYVRPFVGAPAATGSKIPISTMGGDFAVWQRDGKELFFIGSDLKVYAVQTADFGRGTVSQPKALFTPCPGTALAGLPMQGTPWDHPYDVSPNGQQFLINCATSSPGRFDVMVNWMERFK